MPKTVTLRLEDGLYEKLKKLAKKENRPLANYIITAAMKYAEESLFASDEEMAEILTDETLLESIGAGLGQAEDKKGRLVG